MAWWANHNQVITKWLLGSSAPCDGGGLRPRWRLDARFVWGAIALASTLLFAMPLLRLEAMRTSYYDLGQYTTNYIMAIDGHFGIAFRSHAHPIMLLVAPMFRLVPRVETLLILQSAVLILGIGLYARLWERAGAGKSREGAGLILLSIALWSVALFDYHFEHFLFPLYVLFFLRLERESRYVQIELAFIAVAICLVKENYALTSAALGLYLILATRHFRVGVLITIGASIYFLAMTMYVIPIYSDGRQAGDLWHDAFAYLGRTPIEILVNVLAQPWIVIEAGLLSPRKLMFMAALAIPFLLAVWRSPLLALPALPHIGIMLLSKAENHSYLANQYTVPIVLPLLVAFAYVVGKLRHRPLAGALMAQLSTNSSDNATVPPDRSLITLGFVGSLAMLMLFGLAPGSRLFLSPSVWSFNAAAYVPTTRNTAIAALLARHVPVDRAIAVAAQNTLHYGRLSLRIHAFGFPTGVFEPVRVLRSAALATHGPEATSSPTVVAAKRGDAAQKALGGAIYVDYVVLDLKRPWFINDRPAPPGSDAAQTFLWLVERLPEKFEQIAAHDGVQIWRRRPAH